MPKTRRTFIAYRQGREKRLETCFFHGLLAPDS